MEDKFGLTTDEFIEAIINLEVRKQKRIILCINGYLDLYDKHDYDTNFTEYYDYKRDVEIFVRSKMNFTYMGYLFYIKHGHTGDGKFFLFDPPSREIIIKWEETKSNILKHLNIDFKEFKIDYECFKFGLKLKNLRKVSKIEFSKKCSLSIGKISIIEDYGFLAKVSDLRTYVELGLGRKFEINISL